MKICDKVFNGGIDIIVSPYHDISQKSIYSEIQSYLNDHNLSKDIYKDGKSSICFMDVEPFFRGIEKDIINGAKDRYYFLNKYYKDSKSIITEMKEYFDSNEIIEKSIIENRIQVFIIIGSDESISYEDFYEYPYHFFYLTEAKNIFGRALLDAENKEVFKGWKN